MVVWSLGGDAMIERLLTGLPLSLGGIVVVCLLFVFLLGFLRYFIHIALIVLPLVRPVVQGLGLDIVWFTVLFAVCLQTSFLTPPFGYALFYLRSVAPKSVTIVQIYRGVVPFILRQLAGLAIVFLYEDLVTWLPRLAYGGL